MRFSIDEFLAAINDRFDSLRISYQNVAYNGNIPVFTVECATEESLTSNWTKVVDAIAFDFQSQLSDEFQIWNIYIFFIRPAEIADPVSFNSIKLKIENDTFSSRKIVVEESDPDVIINEHIINRNVNFFPENDAEASATLDANPLLWSILEDKVLKKQKMTGEAGPAFEELVNTLKKQRNEI